jgi:hypothetical protein
MTLARRLLDKDDLEAAAAVSVLLCVAEAGLCALIIWRVPYTEIDWTARTYLPQPNARRSALVQAYMEEVGGFIAGERDYSKLEGGTGTGLRTAGRRTAR